MIKYEFQYYSIINYLSIGSNFIVVVFLMGIRRVARQRQCFVATMMVATVTGLLVLFVVEIQTIVNFRLSIFVVFSLFRILFLVEMYNNKLHIAYNE